jgi:hypothetical protein
MAALTNWNDTLTTNNTTNNMARGYNAKEGGYMPGRGRSWNRFDGDPRGTAIGRTADGETIYGDDEGNEWTSSGKDLTANRAREKQNSVNETYFSAISRQKDAVDANDRLKEKTYVAGSKGDVFKKSYDEAKKIARKVFEEAEAKAKEEWQAANPGKDYAGEPRQRFVNEGLKAASRALMAAYPDPMLKYSPTTSLPDDTADKPKDEVETLKLKNEGAGLALAKLTDDKRKFLILKKHMNPKGNLAIGRTGTQEDGWSVGFFNR